MKYFDCEPVRVTAPSLQYIDAEKVECWDGIFPQLIKDGRMQRGMSGMWLKVKEHGRASFINAFPFTFDIETTNAYTTTGEVAGFMYHWASTYDRWYITGRTWESFIRFYNAVVKASGCGERKTGSRSKQATAYRLYCCVHNFGAFEWQYIRSRLNFDKSDFFAKSERKVLYAGTKECVRFIDTCAISGASLATTAKLWGLPTHKMSGDLDYNIPRNSKTNLSQQEQLYVYADVAVLHESWTYLVETYVRRGLPIPLTMTQKLRHDVKLDAYPLMWGDYLNYFIGLFPDDLQDYLDLFDNLLTGGYNHSSNLTSGEVVSDVYGMDFTSSYPAVMLQSRHFPASKFKPVQGGVGLDNPSIRGRHGYCAVGRVRFYGLQCTGSHTIMSLSKSFEYTADKHGGTPVFEAIGTHTIDNGRVFYAERITFYLTDLDFRAMEKFYKWEHYEVLDCKYAVADYLPDYVRDNIFLPYAVKQNIKYSDPNHDANPVYSNAKNTVCGIYGMMIEKPHHDVVSYKDGVVYRKDSRTSGMSDYEYMRYLQFGSDWELVLAGKRKPRTVLSPYWGVFVASIARYRLLCGYEDSDLEGAFVTLGTDAIYGDTDSVYFRNYEKYAEWFKLWNTCLEYINKDVIDTYNDSHAMKLDYETFRTLGTFEPISKDGKAFRRFKALGAKRYIKETSTGEVIATVAGCPKKTRVDGKEVSLIEYTARKKGIDVFDFFEDGMSIPSCRNMSYYSDSPVQALVIDQEGNVELMSETTSVGIFPVDFSVKMDEDYLGFLESIEAKGGHL